MLTGLLKRLLNGGELDDDEMAAAIGAILDGDASAAQSGAFLIAARLKGETGNELAGAASALMRRRRPVATSRGPLVDTCGTGGDRQNTFNISTGAALVAAAAGAVVAKQVGDAVSSRAGSADTLVELGVDLSAADRVGEQCLEELGIGFFHAPIFHPALAKAEPLRRELVVRTIFDLILPLANPAGARRRLVGVADKALLWPMAEALRQLRCDRAWVVRGQDGVDEISVCAPTRVVEWTGDEMLERTLKPDTLGIPRHNPEALHGGTPTENAQIMKEVLAGKRPGAIHDAVALNAAAALVVAGAEQELSDALARAQSILIGGDAAMLLDRVAAGDAPAEDEGGEEA